MKVFTLSFILLVFFSGKCHEDSGLQNIQPHELQFVASTPADTLIKSILGITVETPIDFMRWYLVLNNDRKSFILNIHYGVSQPNTKGFAAGDEKRSYSGIYIIDRINSGTFNGEIYTLKTDSFNAPGLSFVKVGDRMPV
jgi:hypothetical protein